MSTQTHIVSDSKTPFSNPAENKTRQGSLPGRCVAWLRGEKHSPLQKTLRKILAVAIASLLALSLVGIPVLIHACRDWNAQKMKQPVPVESKPAFLEKPSPEILFAKLAKATEEKKVKDKDTLFNNFEVLQRFSDIPCVKETAVEVKGFYPYLHANHVNYHAEAPLGGQLPARILTQAPLRQTQEQFWRCALENSGVIVDLTRPADKIAKYYPEAGEKKVGKITVKNLLVSKMEHDIAVYRFLVTDAATGLEKQITRIHYPNWSDYSGIDKENLKEIEYLCSLERAIKMQAKDTSPTLTHCRAGVGRAGTYTVSSALTELFRQGLLTEATYVDWITRLILSGRCQRGEVFVQSSSQLNTLLELCERLIVEGAAFQKISLPEPSLMTPNIFNPLS